MSPLCFMPNRFATLVDVKAVLCKQQLARGLAPGDAAPDLQEVVTLFERKRAWRVIRYHHLKPSVAEGGPHGVEAAGRAERWCALSESAHPLQVVLRIEKVVRAGFATYVAAVLPRHVDQGGAGNQADMHDVQPATRLTSPRDRVVHRGELGFPWSRLEEVVRGGAFWIRELGRILSVHQQDGVQLRDSFHALAQSLFIARWKFVDAARAHECLETDRAAIRELGKLMDVARHQAAPKTEIHERGALGGLELEVECRPVDGDRQVVQRH